MLSYNTTRQSSNPEPPTLGDYFPALGSALAKSPQCTRPRNPSFKDDLQLNGLMRAFSMDPEPGLQLAQACEDSLVRQYLEERWRRRRAYERQAWTLTAVRRPPLRPYHATRARRPAGVHVRGSRRRVRRATSRASPSADPDGSSPAPPLASSPSWRGAHPLWVGARSAHFCTAAAELCRAVAWLRSPAVRTPRTKRERAPWAPSPRCTLQFSLTDFALVTSQHCRNRMNHMTHRRFT